MINRVLWDSDFFGYEIGDCFVNTNQLDIDAFKKSAQKFKLVYIFSNQEVKNLSEENDIELADIKVFLEKTVDNNITPCQDIQEFNPEIHDYKRLLDLAFLSGKYSRFRNDKHFKIEEFHHLYQKWLDKSIKHKIAFKVLVKILNNEIAGFVTIQKNSPKTSQIGLISVHPDFQGKGIASQLIKSAEHESLLEGFTFFQVPTQQANKPAINLYQKNGFEILNKKYIYHFWNKNYLP